MDDLMSTISNITKTIKKTSGDMLKSTKLNIKLSNEEVRLREIYIEMGKKVREIYSYGGSLGEFFDKKIFELREVERNIERIKEEIGDVNGNKVCRKCGSKIAKTCEFCPKCGEKYDTFGEKEKNVSESVENYKEKAEIKIETKICNVCKHENNASEKFCCSCGRML